MAFVGSGGPPEEIILLPAEEPRNTNNMQNFVSVTWSLILTHSQNF